MAQYLRSGAVLANFARRISVFALALLAVFLANGALAAQGPQFPDPPRNAWFDVASAPVVVIGKVGDSNSQWSKDKSLIFTYTDFQIESVTKGNVNPVPIQIRTFGGLLADGTGQWTEHQPVFVKGQTSRLFLTQSLDGQADEFEVYGSDLGKQDAVEENVAEAAGPCPYSSSDFAGNGYCLVQHRWDFSALPVPYRVNANASGVTGEETAAQAAFNTWTNAPASLINFSYGGLTSTYCTNGSDGINTVYWSSPNCLGPCNGFAYYGYTTYRYNSYQLNAFDTEMCSAWTWATGVQSGAVDIQAVVTHEAGHALGLDHIGNNGDCALGLIMTDFCIFLGANPPRRSLGWGDLDGARVLYPIDNTLIIGETSPTVYFSRASNGLFWKRSILNPLTLEAVFGPNGWNTILRTSDTLISGFATGADPVNAWSDGYLIKGSAASVYVMRSSLKSWMTGSTFTQCNYGFDAVATVSDGALPSSGATLSAPPCPYLIPPQGHLIKNVSDATVYVMDGGRKRPIASATVFNQCTYVWAFIDTLANSYVINIPSGATVTGSPCPH